MTTAIVVTRNQPELLRRCLESLAGQPELKKTVVWDNGADPVTRALCKEFGALRLGSGVNESFSAANNEAIKKTKGDVLLVNNDVFLQPGCLGALLRAKDEGCDVVGTKLLYPDGRVQHYGIGFSRDYMSFHVGRYESPESPWCSLDRVVAATTFACVLIDRKLWDSLGGLDEEYNYSHEDVDFCLRAKEVGAVVGVVHDALAIHLESQTPGRSSHDAENLAIFERKWIKTGRIYGVLGVWPNWVRKALEASLP